MNTLNIDFDFVINFIYEKSGIVLSRDKIYLIESRLAPVVKLHRFENLYELVEHLKRNHRSSVVTDTVDALTTNESFFFRDVRPFEQFKNIMIPAILRTKRSDRRIRIWCAAGSTGQEPYSIAMCIQDMQRELAGWNIHILATDLSVKALNRAKAGIYTQFEVQRGLSPIYLNQHFDKTGDRWQIKNSIRNMVEFRQHNLMGQNDCFGMFDIIFLRNVLIYFSQDRKRRILNELADQLNQNGFICLGGTETILGITKKLTPAKNAHGLYQNPLKCDTASHFHERR